MNPIPYGRHCIDEEDIRAVVEVLRSDHLTQGPKVDELEQELAAVHGCRYAVAYANGTAALHGAYAAAGVEAGDECISTAMTFSATSNAAVYCGGVPVLCDIEPGRPHIDISKCWSLVTQKTKTITPMAYGGYPMDLRELYRRASDRGITLIYDAAHAAGARRNGRGLADDADMAVLSFHPVKHVAAGEGGAVLTNRKDLYEKLRLFRTHGITKDPARLLHADGGWYYEMQELGYNYRLPDILCALCLSQLGKLEYSLRRRNQIAAIYDESLQEISWLQTPENLFEGPEDIHAYHLYATLVEKGIDRQDFYQYLHSKGILAQVHYIPVHYMPFYQDKYGYRRGDFPMAEDFYNRELSLPMYPALTEDQQAYVIETVKAYRPQSVRNV